MSVQGGAGRCALLVRVIRLQSLLPSSWISGRHGTSMKAWRTYAYEDIRLDEVADAAAGPSQLLVKILTVQSSITEVAQLRGYRTSNYDYIKEKISAQAPLPMFGHEFCGRSLSWARE